MNLKEKLLLHVDDALVYGTLAVARYLNENYKYSITDFYDAVRAIEDSLIYSDIPLRIISMVKDDYISLKCHPNQGHIYDLLETNRLYFIMSDKYIKDNKTFYNGENYDNFINATKEIDKVYKSMPLEILHRKRLVILKIYKWEAENHHGAGFKDIYYRYLYRKHRDASRANKKELDIIHEKEVKRLKEFRERTRVRPSKDTSNVITYAQQYSTREG